MQKIDKSNSVLLRNNVDLIDLNHSLDEVENWGRHFAVLLYFYDTLLHRYIGMYIIEIYEI